MQFAFEAIPDLAESDGYEFTVKVTKGRKTRHTSEPDRLYVGEWNQDNLFLVHEKDRAETLADLQVQFGDSYAIKSICLELVK